jgi:hypothetical protein
MLSGKRVWKCEVSTVDTAILLFARLVLCRGNVGFYFALYTPD